ncbi:hypothetical protein DDE19_14025 [Micromonospora ureilytica]|uniref:Uncharacterized protein n=1 Tax=Micromonospora ureilytica TaxID=709868 RepID=A0A3N9XUB8_9ACTN|nr:hypothetical protein DDE19_14025 [Micromonospora ureilytica]
MILAAAFFYVRKHSNKWAIMGFAVAVLFGFAAVAQLALAAAPAEPDRESPPSTPAPSTAPAASSPTPQDLHYQLSSSPGDSHTVKVTATASGEPEPGLTYWFILEVNWGDGNSDYYPRRKMTGRSTSFDLTIPANAETTYLRNGRIYGLDSAQNSQAEDLLKRQGASGVNDFFDEATGQPVSDTVKLPY